MTRGSLLGGILCPLLLACCGGGDTLPETAPDIGSGSDTAAWEASSDPPSDDAPDDSFGGDALEDSPEPADTETAHDLPDTDEPDVPRDEDVVSDAPIDADAGAPDPRQCPAEPLDVSGDEWVGWANLQWPSRLAARVDVESDPVYGQVWRAGETDLPGAAAGWTAELLVGPLGTVPTQQPACWRRFDAAFNVDSGNNDEYRASVIPWSPGLFGMAFRYRPSGGAWRYGDLDGSDNGLHPSALAVLEVGGATSESLRVVTLNLRCQADEWPARRELVVSALVRLEPDLVGFQEDCAPLGGDKQSVWIRAQLADRLDRGYELLTETTHVAEHDGVSYDEGIAVLSRFPVGQSDVLELPYATFPRKAIKIRVDLGGRAIDFYDTHFDFGSGASAERTSAAEQIVADAQGGEAIVVGDLNAEPSSSEVQTLSEAFVDVWSSVNGAGGATMPASNPTRRIDYVFVTDGLSPTAASLIDERSGSVTASDHLGVTAALGL